jgi:phosphatidate phosphatase LPIN
MFKIKVLWKIKKVFSDTIHNPIYAGFGNKSTDAMAYSVIGIENHRIFTI